jgi:hypothetical protein
VVHKSCESKRLTLFPTKQTTTTTTTTNNHNHNQQPHKTGDDTLNGLEGDDVLDGQKGEDTMNGGPGNDLAKFDNDYDDFTGGPGTDTAEIGGTAKEVYLNDDVEIIKVVGAKATTVYGGDGPQTITGNKKPNYIDGGAGGDTLTGGLGADVFSFEYGESSVGTGVDTIADFEGRDVIRITEGGKPRLPADFKRLPDAPDVADAKGALTAVLGPVSDPNNEFTPLIGAYGAAIIAGAGGKVYLVVDDGNGDRSDDDIVVNLTVVGALPPVGPIPVESWFTQLQDPSYYAAKSLSAGARAQKASATPAELKRAEKKAALEAKRAARAAAREAKKQQGP